MASTSSVSGLVSGLDTSTLVSQLIAVERNSQTLLKAKLTTEQSNVSKLQALNKALASLTTSAEKLTKADAWKAFGVTSSSTKVTATATTAATPGSVSFTVNQLASAHAVSSADSAALTDTVVTGDASKVQLTLPDGTVSEIDAKSGSLSDLVAGLNATGTGVKAGLIKLDDGSYRLRVASSATGADAAFTLTASDGSDLLGGATVLTQGRDASITVGADTLTSATNMFAGVVTGLDITLGSGLTAGEAVDLTVTQDTASVTASVQSLVEAVNTLIADMDSATAYSSSSSGSSKTGTLAGDTQVRSVRNALLDSVYPADGSTMAGLGIQTDRYGKLVFDEAAFTKALKADPDKVAAAFTAGTGAGFAERVRKVADGASDSIDGTITSAIKGRTSSIDRLQDSIDAWDLRLELRQATLTKQFTAMETALSALNSQSSWLTAQISSMSTSSDS
jgi:flagellar hook-associated protein 2